MSENEAKTQITSEHKVSQHPHLWILFFAILFAVLSVIFCSTSTSFLYPKTNLDNIDIDSNYFLYSGYLLLEGRIPYLEIFDHKGLYHVAINALGVLLGGRYGVFFLQIVFNSVGLFFLFETIYRLGIKSRFYTFMAGLFYLVLRFSSMAGNQEGEWVFPFMAMGLYFFLPSLLNENKRDLYIGSLILGLEMGLSLNARPLDALAAGSLFIAYFVYWCHSCRDFKRLLIVVSLAIFGLFVPFFFIIPFAVRNGYLEIMFLAIFVQGGHYIDESLVSLERLLPILLIVLLFALTIFFYFHERKHKNINQVLNEILFVHFLVFELVFLLVFRYMDYLWVYYPSFIITFVLYLNGIKIEERLRGRRALLLGTSSYVSLFVVVFLSIYYTSGAYLFGYYEQEKIENDISLIPYEYRRTPGAVYALGVDPGIYIVGEIEVGPCPYFAYQHWWLPNNSTVLPRINEYLGDSEEQPHYLLVSILEEEQKALEPFMEVVEENYVRQAPEYLPRWDNNQQFEIWTKIGFEAEWAI